MNNVITNAPCEGKVSAEKLERELERLKKLMINKIAMHSGNNFSEDRFSIANHVWQEACLRAHKYLYSYDPQYTLGAWINKIVWNTFLRYVKSMQSQKIKTCNLEVADYANVVDNACSFSSAQSVFNHAYYGIRLKEALDMIETLPEDLRNTLYRVEVLGENPKDVAKSMGVSVQILRVRLFRAKKLMRSKIGDEDIL